jgi:photosystem II stability/assembly factor-like uncharacterized protein
MLSELKSKAATICALLMIGSGAIYFVTREFNDIETGDITTGKQKVPNDWLFRQRAYPFGSIDTKTYFAAIAGQKEKNSQRRNKGNPEWQFCGPDNISGRVTDIEMTDATPYIIYVGSASGGIFRSEDEGQSWDPVFDQQASLSIGDLAIAAGDQKIIYAGTGEANAGGGSLAYDGNGIYKSIDGGDTWIHLGLDEVGSIGKVIIDPGNPDVCFAGAMGPLFENTSHRGVYRTRDGGQSWEKVLFINDSTGIIDMAIDPQHSDTLFAAGWERVRRVNRRSYGGPSSGIYRSMDGGDTWHELTNGLPVSAGRIGIAISHSNPEILYASYVHETTDLIKGIYKSTDHGNTWFQINSAGIAQQPYMWWFGKIYVDPNDPDIVYVAGYEMEKSVDGGHSWKTVFNSAHVDQHALCIHPHNSQIVLAGNDGGVYRSEMGGSAGIPLPGLPTFQFYTCEIDHLMPERLFGGAQDNGISVVTDLDLYEWDLISTGDGFRVLIDPVDNDYWYMETQYGNLIRSTDGGFSFDGATNGIHHGDRFNWHTPVILHPNDPSILFYGTNRLYKSINRAEMWSVISPDLTDNADQHNLVFGTITSISVSPVNDQIIYVGTDDGNVQVTLNGGMTWSKVSSALPDRWVTSVNADPEDENTAFVTYSGFRFGEAIGHIYKTTNKGAHWIDISGDLPDVPVNDLIVAPFTDQVFIATDIGVFHSTDEGLTWESLGSGLPNVVITDLDFHATEKLLVAASYGRGMYRIDLDDLNTAIHEAVDENTGSLQVIPNPFSSQTIIYISIAEKALYSISLFNSSGEIAESLYHGILNGGRHEFRFDASRLPAGLYICAVANINNGAVSSKKVIKTE